MIYNFNTCTDEKRNVVSITYFFIKDNNLFRKTYGIKAANRAGIFVIGYKAEDSNQNYETADLVISDYREVNLEVIKGLEK